MIHVHANFRLFFVCFFTIKELRFKSPLEIFFNIIIVPDRKGLGIPSFEEQLEELRTFFIEQCVQLHKRVSPDCM